MDHSAELAREAAAGFADKLRLIIPTEEIRLHGMKFDADLFDVEVEHNGWGITVSFDKRGKSLRLLLDDYVIENLTEKDALSFIDALAAGRAKVRVSKVPVFGKTVRLELQRVRRSGSQHAGDGDQAWRIGSGAYLRRTRPFD